MIVKVRWIYRRRSSLYNIITQTMIYKSKKNNPYFQYIANDYLCFLT